MYISYICVFMMTVGTSDFSSLVVLLSAAVY